MPVEEVARRQLEKILSHGRIPGCSLAVVDRGGHVHCDAFGLADLRSKRPATVDTVYHLFSGTKLYTAAALMLLQERGLVSLDETLSTYLGDSALRHPVTIRQLASHNSGLRDTLRGFFAVHLPGEPMPTTAEALSRYRLDHGNEPGQGAAYRNVNYAILGQVVATVVGQSYTSFVRETCLDPLGVRLGFEYDDECARDEAIGYMNRFSPMRLALRVIVPGLLQRIEGPPVDGRVELARVVLDTAAIGGLIGCAKDFIPFVSEFLSADDGLLTADSKRAMLTLQSRGRAGIASKVGMGIGWKLGRLRGGVEFWNHEGGGPGFTSETRIYPSEGLGFVVLMNTTQAAKVSWLAHEICELLRAAYQS